MTAFEDYCIVCERICESGQAYCSPKCKQTDSTSPFLATTKSNVVPVLTVVSPLLTPQVNPRKSIVESLMSPRTHASLHSRMSYESPLLPSATHPLADLDSNSLDLNISKSFEIHEEQKQQQQQQHGLNIIEKRKQGPEQEDHQISNISSILSKSTSENYKKWLSTH